MLGKLRSINSWMDEHSSVLSAWASLVAIVGVPLLLLVVIPLGSSSGTTLCDLT